MFIPPIELIDDATSTIEASAGAVLVRFRLGYPFGNASSTSVVSDSLASVAITVVFGAGGGGLPPPTVHDVMTRQDHRINRMLPSSRPSARGVQRDLQGLGGGGVDRW